MTQSVWRVVLHCDYREHSSDDKQKDGELNKEATEEDTLIP